MNYRFILNSSPLNITNILASSLIFGATLSLTGCGTGGGEEGTGSGTGVVGVTGGATGAATGSAAGSGGFSGSGAGATPGSCLTNVGVFSFSPEPPTLTAGFTITYKATRTEAKGGGNVRYRVEQTGVDITLGGFTSPTGSIGCVKDGMIDNCTWTRTFQASDGFVAGSATFTFIAEQEGADVSINCVTTTIGQ